MIKNREWTQIQIMIKIKTFLKHHRKHRKIIQENKLLKIKVKRTNLQRINKN